MPRPKSVSIGDKFKTNRHSDVRVIEYVNAKKILVRFSGTGSEVWTSVSSAQRGQVFDPYDKYMFGVGYYGELYRDGGVDSRLRKESWDRWSGILRRCYDPEHYSYEIYGGSHVRVSEEWHNFSNFYRWFSENYIKGWEIDADLFSNGYKKYCEEKCVFLPKRLNQLLIRGWGDKKGGPPGIYKNGSKFVANANLNYIGSYKTASAAFNAYKEYKANLISSEALKYFESGQINRRVYTGLLEYAEDFHKWESIE